VITKENEENYNSEDAFTLENFLFTQKEMNLKRNASK
jgi:hypothetical protein